MTALPVIAGHDVTVQKVGGWWLAHCSCGWPAAHDGGVWRSRFESVAERQGDGHLYNEARKAA